MENTLKGLFGGNGGNDDHTAKANDFVKRVTTGPRDQGFEANEAVDHLNQLLPHANSEQVQRAAQQALGDLPKDQQAEFGNFVSQLHQRQPSGQNTGNGFSLDGLSQMFGQAGGSANSAGDLFGGLLGGGGGGGLLGGLLGGGSQSNNSQHGGGGGGLSDFLSSGVGKMVLGGLAAYLAKDLLGGRH
jgi:hypothetical protein